VPVGGSRYPLKLNQRMLPENIVQIPANYL
jgi:hypothetical protein